MPSILVQIAATPVNSAIVILNSLIWFYMWNRRISFDHVSISYRKVIEQYQYYRIFTAAFTHLDIMHILFNMSALWSVGSIEIWKGSVWYIETTVLLIFFSKFFWLSLMHVLIHRGQRADYRDSAAVGYSGVIFGWMTILLMLDKTYSISLPGNINLPFVIMPFIYLIVTKILLPRSSFTGHLAGIFAGYLISWNLFDWLRGYWLWSTFVILMVIIILSLSANQALPSFLARCIQVSPEYVQSSPLSVLHNDTTRSNETVHRIMDNGVLRVHRPLDRNQIIINAVPLRVEPLPSDDTTTVGEEQPSHRDNSRWWQRLFSSNRTTRSTSSVGSNVGRSSSNPVPASTTTVSTTINPLSATTGTTNGSPSSSQGAAAIPSNASSSSIGKGHTTIDIHDDDDNLTDDDNNDTDELLNRSNGTTKGLGTGSKDKPSRSHFSSFLSSRHI